ncbi:MAG: lytic transglycosylase domain-containing protein [Desulfobacteraceae bacterium]
MNIKAGLPMLAAVLLTSAPCSQAACVEVPGRLLEIIASENIAALESSVSQGGYRGEAGILRLKPEAAADLGLKVHVTDDYEEGLSLYQAAEESLREARRAMTRRGSGASEDEAARTIATKFLAYKELKKKARSELSEYRASLEPELDERLDPLKCGALMKELLEAGLDRLGGRLRDAVGCLYNTCMDVDSDACLTTENVRFVNAVFSRFTNEATPEELAGFDLDCQPLGHERLNQAGWRKVASAEAPDLIPFLEAALEQTKSGNPVRVDPLLFLALMKRESSFNPSAVSHVGAAGLTQIMPATAEDLGMKNIFRPDYFDQAFSILAKEREFGRKATSELFSIEPENALEKAALARELMQESLKLKKERERLFSRYRRELAGKASDPRFMPQKAVSHGLRYFARLLEAQQGDISLALASYNAGPHRVEQYGGIPPFAETVRFRNKVLEFYRDYLNREAKQLLTRQ